MFPLIFSSGFINFVVQFCIYFKIQLKKMCLHSIYIHFYLLDEIIFLFSGKIYFISSNEKVFYGFGFNFS